MFVCIVNGEIYKGEAEWCCISGKQSSYLSFSKMKTASETLYLGKVMFPDFCSSLAYFLSVSLHLLISTGVVIDAILFFTSWIFFSEVEGESC